MESLTKLSEKNKLMSPLQQTARRGLWFDDLSTLDQMMIERSTVASTQPRKILLGACSLKVQFRQN
jgi:hypothetical protein